jgi:hypothetical protein
MSKSISFNAYELKFLKIYERLYRTFFVSLLEPYSRKKGEESSKLVNFNKENRF